MIINKDVEENWINWKVELQNDAKDIIDWTFEQRLISGAKWNGKGIYI